MQDSCYHQNSILGNVDPLQENTAALAARENRASLHATTAIIMILSDRDISIDILILRLFILFLNSYVTSLPCTQMPS